MYYYKIVLWYQLFMVLAECKTSFVFQNVGYHVTFVGNIRCVNIFTSYMAMYGHMQIY